MIQPPTYEDGKFALYRIGEKREGDFPRKILESQDMEIWYRELAVFDRLRYEFDQSNIEVTMKIAIPEYKKIDSKCACEMDGEIHVVYNAAHVTTKDGFRETELTLIRPKEALEKE